MNCIYQYWVGGLKPPAPARIISHESVSKYSDKINCEYIYDTRLYDKLKTCENIYISLFNWVRIIFDPYFDKFDNVLFLDSDIIIARYAENIFEYVDDNAEFIGCQEHNEFNHLLIYDTNINEVPILSNGEVPRLINSGVMIFTKKCRLFARDIFEPIDDYYHKELIGTLGQFLLYDEFYLLAMLNKYNFNIQLLDVNSWNAEPNFPFDANFYHFSGDLKYNKTKLDEILEYV